MQIKRIIKQQILNRLTSDTKAVILYGPRQVGKTTLCVEIIEEIGLKTKSINADEQRFVTALSSQDSRTLRDLAAGYDLLFIDEAQRVPNIGINLKILIDSMPDLKILATGSSSFELANSVSEPLTGRKWVYNLYPVAQLELAEHYNRFELSEHAEERLRWGSYPEVFSRAGADRESYLHLLTSDYLYKDLFALSGIRHADKLRNLVTLIAFQIGREVSLNELASRLGITKETVAHYLDLLQKAFVLFRLTGFSRNLRKEVTKKSKYYFYDLGIRNSIIDNFKPMALRDDSGQLWENFLVIERIKRNQYLERTAHSYFWRTYTGSEIDYIEERNAALTGFEFSWSGKKKRMPTAWQEQYPDASWKSVHRDNWLDFVLA